MGPRSLGPNKNNKITRRTKEIIKCTRHTKKIIKQHGVIGIAAGSLFIFKGPYKAVLINYPNREEKNKLF